ncbi:hypothetical protein BRC86_09675 [Halobacteriales archaeon QS_3_64_16]|nr:MAG: hypothetical protein BRC86_09675 [Halobacteriales archaeon QS_3_64_16]
MVSITSMYADQAPNFFPGSCSVRRDRARGGLGPDRSGQATSSKPVSTDDEPTVGEPSHQYRCQAFRGI